MQNKETNNAVVIESPAPSLQTLFLQSFLSAYSCVFDIVCIDPCLFLLLLLFANCPEPCLACDFSFGLPLCSAVFCCTLTF